MPKLYAKPKIIKLKPKTPMNQQPFSSKASLKPCSTATFLKPKAKPQSSLNIPITSVMNSKALTPNSSTLSNIGW